MNGSLWWELARASGIVAWLMLTASVLWGVFLSTNLLQRRARPAWLLDLHRWLGGLTIGFVGAHIAALVADSFVHFGRADVLVPFASSWKAGAVALGVAGMWLLLAVELSSLVMKKLPRRTWHAVHLTSYVTFWLVTFHGALAGTDATQPLYRATSVLGVVAVVFATAYRILAGRKGSGAPRRPRGSAPVAHRGSQAPKSQPVPSR